MPPVAVPIQRLIRSAVCSTKGSLDRSLSVELDGRRSRMRAIPDHHGDALDDDRGSGLRRVGGEVCGPPTTGQDFGGYRAR